LGGLVGLGGGVVMVPLLTGVGGLSQHLAHGTSLLPVAATGFSSTAMFARDCEVNLPAGLVLMSSAFATVRRGARWQAALSAGRLRGAMGVFMMAGGALIPVKQYLVGETEPSGGGSNRSMTFLTKLRTDYDQLVARPGLLLLYATTGAVAGVLSGLLGVGGGILMNPVMSLVSPMSQAEVVGTTLLSMVPASLLGARTHWLAGNVCKINAGPLVAGSLLGALAGSNTALEVEEDQLRACIAVTLVALGARMAFV